MILVRTHNEKIKSFIEVCLKAFSETLSAVLV